MTREKILDFVRDYYDETGKIPSVRIIAKEVEGVNRANFYGFISSTDELPIALGIEPIQTPRKPVEAMAARRAKGDKSYRITLSETQSQRFAALAFMEGCDVGMVIDGVLDRERQIREIMVEVNEGVLDSEIIEAVLHPELVYKGLNVSEFAGKPWIMMNCYKCGEPILCGEGIEQNKWLFEFMPLVKRMIRITCADCQPKPPVYIRIPA